MDWDAEQWCVVFTFHQANVCHLQGCLERQLRSLDSNRDGFNFNLLDKQQVGDGVTDLCGALSFEKNIVFHKK